jgi:hypothetical protein
VPVRKPVKSVKKLTPANPARKPPALKRAALKPAATAGVVKKPHFAVESALAVEILPPASDVSDWIDGGRQFADLAEANLYAKRVDANIKLLAYKRATGELVERSLVKEMAAENSRKTRDALNALIDRMSPELAALTEPKLVRQYLNEHFSQFFTDLEAAWLYPKRTA